MKSIIFPIGGLITLTLSMLTFNVSATEKPILSVERVVIHSPALEANPIKINSERELIIVLPPSYASQPDKQYPVVYLLHGFGATAEGWFSNISGEPNIERSLQHLYQQQKISEMIVVVPNSYNKIAKNGWYSNSAFGGNWEDYIIKDVIPYIDKNFRTNKKQRGLAGGSVGGYGTFRLAMKHPQMFGAIYAMSASLADSSGRDFFNSEARLAELNETLLKPQDQLQDWEKINYSIALSFAPSNKAPRYIQLPITQKQIDIFKDNSLDRLLITHLDNFKKHAPVIKFDVGTNDAWTKNELLPFNEKLKNSGIKASYSEYVGGHTDKLGLLADHEIFQYFSLFFTNTLPDTLPGSLE